MKLTCLGLFSAVAAAAQDTGSVGAGPAEPMKSTGGPPSFAACAGTAAWRAAFDSPVECDMDWGGCANRYGLSIVWRPDSQAAVSNALLRASYRLPDRTASIAVDFWPDIRKRVFRR